MEEITAPGDDTEDEQHPYTKLLIATGGYRRRHHRVGPDIPGPRPAGLNSEDWDLLTDAIDQYTHARVQRRLVQMRDGTAAERATLLPPPHPCTHPRPTPTGTAGNARHLERNWTSWFRWCGPTRTARGGHRCERGLLVRDQ
ncbi:hypothetical protein ACFW6E_42430 [Streptomyces olivaceoviridis]|uniref:hypothetical protein n=1 Tax=Streptomyces olivaceoviridis TaxID=1921 RepID=UPI0036C43247